MASQSRYTLHDSPVHAHVGVDGAIRIFLPDGHSLLLTAEAAARSSGILARVASAARQRPREEANVIAADFVNHARIG